MTLWTEVYSGFSSNKTFKIIVFTNDTIIACKLWVFVILNTRFRVNYALQLPECQRTGCSKQAQNRKFKWFTLKRVCDMIKTHCQMHYINKYSQHSSIICPVWLNGRVFVYKLGGRGFQSRCSHLNFQYRACFKQAVPWHSGNCKG